MTQTKKEKGCTAKRLLSPLPTSLLIGALTLAGVSGRAEAKLLEVYADAYAGAMYGTEPNVRLGSVVTPMGNDFYRDNSGALLGLRAGVEILYTDFYLQFDQMVTERGFSASNLQAMLGWDFGIGDGPWRGTLGAFGGMAFGFNYPPQFHTGATPGSFIDTSQIATVGVAAELQGGVERVLSRLFRLQLIATAGYHYMFAGSSPYVLDPAVGNSTQTVTHGFHLLLKAGIRFNLGI
jgi:hypothetical protein